MNERASRTDITETIGIDIPELSPANFDLIVERAKKSTVPLLFGEAYMSVLQKVNGMRSTDKDFSHSKSASILFERNFSKSTLADYAIVYCQTVFVIKNWLEMEKDVKEALEDEKFVRNMLNETFLDTKREEPTSNNLPAEVVDDALESLKEWEGNAKTAAAILFHFENGLTHGKSFVDKLINLSIGIYVPSRDFQNTREEIERYFAKPEKIARMTLLAQGVR